MLKNKVDELLDKAFDKYDLEYKAKRKVKKVNNLLDNIDTETICNIKIYKDKKTNNVITEIFIMDLENPLELYHSKSIKGII